MDEPRWHTYIYICSFNTVVLLFIYEGRDLGHGIPQDSVILDTSVTETSRDSEVNRKYKLWYIHHLYCPFWWKYHDIVIPCLSEQLGVHQNVFGLWNTRITESLQMENDGLWGIRIKEARINEPDCMFFKQEIWKTVYSSSSLPFFRENNIAWDVHFFILTLQCCNVGHASLRRSCVCSDPWHSDFPPCLPS